MRKASHRQIIAVVHAGFVLTGIVTVLLGPLLPVLQSRWAIDDAQAGYLFTAQFIGSITPLAVMSVLIARVGLLRLLVAGYAIMSVGIAALALSSWATGVASVFCYGAGLGLTIPVTNLLISEMEKERRAAALSIVNFTWSIGAVACAPIIGLLVEAGVTTQGLIALALLLVVLGALMLRFQLFIVAREPGEKVEPQGGAFRSPFILLIGALIFLYVGTENAIAGWIATHAKRIAGSPESLWAIAPSVFWAALLAGRAAAPIALRRVVEEKLVLTGLIAAAFGAMILLSTNSMNALIPAVALAGTGLAAVYPITVAMLPRAFGQSATRVAGLIFMLAGLGGATMTWAVGFVSKQTGSLRAGLVVPLFGSVVMIALQAAIIVLLKRKTESNAKIRGARSS